MKIWRLFLAFSLLFFACSNPKPKPQAPNINWTPLDEPPLYPDCPQDNVKLNWDCFAKTQNSCVYIKPSLNLYLTYLRGLEVAELKEEDMPMV